ncbi:MAG: efflux RND transporter periplasmic adaptor subunit [Chitinophagaceae bacterium]|nr:efflux RND transporter periplasmic adaptor subunit [Chitinophagaceae bacterium]
MKKIIISFVAIITLASCKQSDQKPAAATNTQESKPPADATGDIVELNEAQFSRAGITVGDMQSGTVSDIVKVNGVIDAPVENRYTISFPLGGYLKSNSLIPGMYVRKGSLLATMEDASLIQLQQDYLLSKSRQAFLETDHHRQLELNKTQSNSQKTLQQAKTDLETQVITTNALAEKLRLVGIDPASLNENNISRTIHIYSPINGYVSKVNANPGKYVAPTDILFELMDLTKLHIELTVFEKDAAGLKKGQQISFASTQHNGAKGTATVELIAPAFNESRAVEVHCAINPPTPKLLPGSFVTAEIKMENHAGLTVPDEAIVTWQNKQYMFTQEGARSFKMIPVQTGASTNGLTIVQADIPANKKVVTANAYILLTMLKNMAEN